VTAARVSPGVSLSKGRAAASRRFATLTIDAFQGK
jgi:hypothetical protein